MLYSNSMDKIEELLARGVEKVYPSKEELQIAIEKGKLRVYQGFDATSPDLHIGHMVGLRKLRQWQELGHTVIFLIGDFTSTIGDPTGKDSSRVSLTRDQVLQNAKTYKEQAGKILRFDGDNPAQLKFNSEWLGKMSASDFLALSKNVTHSQVVERDMFQERLKKGYDITINEFLYPIMQAYDSVHMDIDVEVGGEDQTFNMLMGRKLLRNLKQKEKFVMTTPLLTDSQGQKIGKSEGNAIALNNKPNDLFAKIMTLSDDVIVKGLEYLTDLPMDKIKAVEKQIKEGENPITHKKRLAFEVVKQLTSHEEAHEAQEGFEKGDTITVSIVKLTKSFISSSSITQGLVELGLATSISDAKRIIEQNGLKINNSLINDPNKPLSDLIKGGETVQRGQKKAVKIDIED